MLTTIKSLPLTLFSRDFYNDLVHKWTGIGFGFIIVILILDLAWPVVGGFITKDPITPYITSFFQEIPAATLKDGKLSIDHPSPYKIQMGQKDSAFYILFDMDHGLGNLDDLKQKMIKEKTIIVVTSKEIAILKDKNGTVQINSFGQNHSDFSMTHDDWVAFGKKVAVFFMPVLLLSLGVIFLIGLFIKMVFGALVAMILSLMFKVEIEFDTGMRLMAAAAIPGAFLSTAFPAIPGLITFALWIGYGMFGLWSARQPNPA